MGAGGAEGAGGSVWTPSSEWGWTAGTWGSVWIPNSDRDGAGGRATEISGFGGKEEIGWGIIGTISWTYCWGRAISTSFEGEGGYWIWAVEFWDGSSLISWMSRISDSLISFSNLKVLCRVEGFTFLLLNSVWVSFVFVSLLE